jgi:hypothetical protein
MVRICKRLVSRCKICGIPVIFNGIRVNGHVQHIINKLIVFLCDDCDKYFNIAYSKKDNNMGTVSVSGTVVKF